MSERARRTRVRMTYNNKDITTDISKYIVGFSYTDNAAGALDTIDLKVEDSERLWQSAWYPGKNALVKCYIDHEENGKVKTLPCGSYRLDELTMDGPPDVFSLKGISAIDETGIRSTKKSRAWQDVTLKTIAEQIAGEHGLQFFWQSSMNMGGDRFDQRDESDLKYLERKLDDFAHSLKLAEEKLIVYSAEEWEQRPATSTLQRSDIDTFSFRSKTHDVYTSCVISYTDPETKETHSYTYAPENAPANGQTLKINGRVKNQADAEKKAKAALHKKNKFEVTGSLTLVGSPDIRAAFIIQLDGFGEFSGRYMIDKVTHSVGSGYTVALEVHKC